MVGKAQTNVRIGPDDKGKNKVHEQVQVSEKVEKEKNDASRGNTAAPIVRTPEHVIRDSPQTSTAIQGRMPNAALFQHGKPLLITISRPITTQNLFYPFIMKILGDTISGKPLDGRTKPISA